MKALKILPFGAPELRAVAKPVSVFHRKLRSEIDAISAALASRDDGAALAGPQVGILKRIVVMDYKDEYLELVNPRIVEMSGGDIGEEACLSFSGYFGRVHRAERVVVTFQSRDGSVITIERSGAVARCLQHEIDHLDGILFVDRMTDPFLTHSESGKKVALSKVREIAGNKPNQPPEPMA